MQIRTRLVALTVAALAIAALAVKEGRDAWQGKGCCAPATASAAATPSDDADACGGADCACCS